MKAERAQAEQIKNEEQEAEVSQPPKSIFLNPEMEQAITLIQAGYKGMETRKQLARRISSKAKLSSKSSENIQEEPVQGPMLCNFLWA